MNHNTLTFFAPNFERYRTLPLIFAPDGLTITWGHVERRSEALAGALLSLGAQPGDRVAVQLPKSTEALSLYLACLRLGLVYAPIHPRYSTEALGFLLGDLAPQVFVCEPSRFSYVSGVASIAGANYCETLDADGSGSLSSVIADNSTDVDANVDADEAESDELPPPIAEVEIDHPACILYPSNPKSRGVVVTHDNLKNNAAALRAIWRLGNEDRLLHALPLFNWLGILTINATLMGGGQVLMIDDALDAAPSNATKDDDEAGEGKADRLANNIERSTVVIATANQYTRLISDTSFRLDPTGPTRLFVSTGQPLAARTFHEFVSRTGKTICEAYGLAETGIITSNAPDGEHMPGTVGFAVPDAEIRVADDADLPLAAGHIGEIQVRGPHVFNDYWLLPEEPTSEIPLIDPHQRDENSSDPLLVSPFTEDGFFRTGDIGSIGRDGRLTVLGKVDDIILTGEHRIFPNEVEIALEDIDGISEAVVVGLPHPKAGEAAIALIIADDSFGDGDDIIIDLDSHLERSLAEHKRPRRYVFVEDFPKGPLGNVDRSKLRVEHQDLFTS